MRKVNVLGTLSALKLCESGKPKRFVFISSTSVLDSEYYVRLSDSLLAKGGDGILEGDDLQGSQMGLPTGYGQTKWVSEQLVMEAGRRGLRGAIVRPGYIIGDSETGGTTHSLLKSLAVFNICSDQYGRLYHSFDQRLRANRPNTSDL